ncbi:MAG: Na+/H+ antiporter subunit D, partial [Clostridiales bacterium]
MSLFLHPGLFLILVGAVAAIVPEKARKIVLAAGPAIAVAMFFTLPHEADLFVIPFINGWELHLMTIDSLSWFFNVFFVILTFLGGVYSMHNPSWGEALASMTYAGATVSMVFAGDWITLIFFWELMAVSSVYLIWANHTARSRRAGFRYLLVHMFGGNLLLAGIFFKVIAGDMMVANVGATHDAAFWLMFFAVCINGVIPPLHAWVADAYPESTITGGAFMSGLTTKAAMYILIRLFAGTDFLIVVGVIMAIYGAIFAIIENDMRRLLSYHIVSQ